MKKRVAYIIIDGKQIGGVGQSLDISFDVTYMGNTLVPLESRFIIDNLKKDDMYYITTNTTLFQDRIRKIEFYCGYEDNYQKIFEGQILKAQPSGQPDTSVTITAWSSIYIMGEAVKVERKNVRYLDLLKDAVDKCHFHLDLPTKLRNSPKLQTTVDNFSFSDSAYQYLSRVIMDISGCNVVKDQLLFTIANGNVSVRSEDNENDPPILEINSGTGMIGIPEPNYAGVDIRMLLDVSLQAGQTIRLTSNLMPIYNGLYNIFGVTHHGNLRSNDFYTDLTCIRVYGGVNGSTYL